MKIINVCVFILLGAFCVLVLIGAFCVESKMIEDDWLKNRDIKFVDVKQEPKRELTFQFGRIVFFVIFNFKTFVIIFRSN